MGETFVNEQEFKFKETDVSCEWSDKYHKKGDINDGMYAEIHKVQYQDLISALKKDGTVVSAQGEQKQ
eukprot:4053697-Prorocentrum_lima.AAC.1